MRQRSLDRTVRRPHLLEHGRADGTLPEKQDQPVVGIDEEERPGRLPLCLREVVVREVSNRVAVRHVPSSPTVEANAPFRDASPIL